MLQAAGRQLLGLGAVSALRLLSGARLARTMETAARGLVVGQPTHETSPLLEEGELFPGLHSEEFAQRRRQLAALLPQNAVVILEAAAPQYMAGVIPYPYRQDADFLYTTGLQQPSCVAVIHKSSESMFGGEDHCFSLFVPPPDAQKEQWEGPTVSREAATSVFGADEAYHLDQFEARMGLLLPHVSVLYHNIGGEGGGGSAAGGSSSVRARQWLRGALLSGRPRREMQLREARPLLHRLRWVKSPSEQRLLRRSADLAASSMSSCMAASSPGVLEAGIGALFEYRCKAAGAQRMAYPPVVAGGASALTIHYSRNDKPLRGGELLLMDAGCELFGYSSDVSRTWPVSGRFTTAQADVYSMVLDVHRACLAACVPGATMRQLHSLSIKLLSEGLVQLGILRGSSDAIMRDAYRRFYPHSVGHWLGLDTHDTNNVPHTVPLQPGVCLTIEPGLYIPDEPHFGELAGIGIRLEDDVLVTEEGADVISAAVPTAIADVEEAVGTRLQRHLQPLPPLQ